MENEKENGPMTIATDRAEAKGPHTGSALEVLLAFLKLGVTGTVKLTTMRFRIPHFDA